MQSVSLSEIVPSRGNPCKYRSTPRHRGACRQHQDGGSVAKPRCPARRQGFAIVSGEHRYRASGRRFQLRPRTDVLDDLIPFHVLREILPQSPEPPSAAPACC